MIAVRTDDEVLPMASQEKGEESSHVVCFASNPVVDFFIWCIPYAFVAIISAAFVGAFWGIWNIFAPIPKFLGYTRFWQDTVAGPVWSIAIVAYVGWISEIRDDLSCDDRFDVYVIDIIKEAPVVFFLGVAGLISLVLGFTLSLASGLALWMVLAVVIFFVYGACYCVMAGIDRLGEFFASFSAGESGEE